MKKNLDRFQIIIICILLVIITGLVVATSVADINYGKGKPKAVDIYVNKVPYGASIGGEVATGTGQKGVGDFKVIVDDDKNPDPQYYDQALITATPTPTPTITPTPTATEVIPVDTGGVGKQVCALDSTTDVIVDLAYSSAGYKNEFKLSSPRSVSLGWSQGEMPDHRTGTALGTTWNLGKFTAGQELIFADIANGVTYKTGPASRNPDNIVHAAVTLKNPSGTYHKYLVTFEDFYNGGDKDYNDLELYVSGNLSTECSTGGSSGGDTGGGSVIPVYTNVCKCPSPTYNVGNKATCIAQFSYRNLAGEVYSIPIRSQSLPWNEFTGSGMVGQNRCQPETFLVENIQPFWTNRFWNNIQWKLGYDHSILVKCEKYTRACNATETTFCASCTDTS